ncbi:MAG TPA: transglycosylase domain-containing protein [Oligoflexia bacterium]|nr:transglycosylase domain-containing protein [Oligoflexia bacterium]HMP47981.1 transglycosylase domain-containing protein [Oligoflexia bacterium]
MKNTSKKNKKSRKRNKRESLPKDNSTVSTKKSKKKPKNISSPIQQSELSDPANSDLNNIVEPVEFSFTDYHKDLNNSENFWNDVPSEKTSALVQFLKVFILLILIGLIPLSILLRNELSTSEIQATYFHNFSSKLVTELIHGEGPVLKAPDGGPYDQRLGYTDLPYIFEKVKSSGFAQDTYTKIPAAGWKLVENGITFPYKSKNQTGLNIQGQNEIQLYSFTEPSWVFSKFEDISKTIVKTLLFIENRNLLDNKNPKKNPAVEWDRFFKAIGELIYAKLTKPRKVPGGSTLATQIEKYKHSPGGRTSSPTDKLKQMLSASIKAYQSSEYTLDHRKEIVLDYINSVPLAALPGYGEIHGLPDGLWAYFGEDPKKINELLSEPTSELDQEKLRSQGKAFKQVLSLFLAHRRPSDYLDDSPLQLQNQVEKYLPLLFKEGIISYPLYKSSLAEQTPYRRVLPSSGKTAFSTRKGPSVVRNHLLSLFGKQSLYELDRLDLQVRSTLNVEVQEKVSRFLLSLKASDSVRNSGLDGFRLLSTSADPNKVIYSFTLFEHENGINKLRVQTDTYDQPLNINEGVKLDLGSTAKFRTIVTYLEVIEEIWNSHKNKKIKELKEERSKARDTLSRWGLDVIINDQNITLEDILRQALLRSYSANPGEKFFTAGGLHTFENFNKEDNGKTVTVSHALRHSINLPFIRLMRDISKYYSFHTQGSSARTIAEMNQETRTEYLEKFADKEGKIFLGRFYEKYKGKNSDEIIHILLDSVKKKPSRFASIYWFLYPEANLESFIEFMKKHIDHAAISEKELKKYFDWYDLRAKTLGDKGYLARMHPLELWLVAFLINNPDASLSKIFDQSKNERIQVYDWLMRTSRKHAQDKRIQILLEAEAFTEIHQRWKNLGYPLPSIVPSYATALGTSADRPDALAELMGIILNDGIRYPKTSIESLHFAKNTPYEASFSLKPANGERVLSETVARIAREGLLDIVQNGTAVRLKDGIKAGNNVLPVGGKTGTGDHRYIVYGKGGGRKESRVVNRTATFMFILGDRFFGVISAFVPGQDAARFKFTSALPVQMLKLLGNDLEGIIINDIKTENSQVD